MWDEGDLVACVAKINVSVAIECGSPRSGVNQIETSLKFARWALWIIKGKSCDTPVHSPVFRSGSGFGDRDPVVGRR
jgi:hypothetical protein